MSALCERYGVSRKTGYKWLKRFQAEGAKGLADRSHAPLQHGRSTPDDLVAAILAEKGAWPGFGPKKIMARLRRRAPDMAWPAVSTAGEILKRHGLVGRRRARWRGAGTGPFAPILEPNAVWSADYKGWFRLKDASRCEPLAVMDGHCRTLLGLKACASTGEAEAWPLFLALFEENGLPERIRSDNGPPFASAGISGLSPLAVRFIKLGIKLERITPGKPQQNGAQERLNLTLTPLASAPARTRAEQQACFDRFRADYNHERPHEAIGMDMPAERYVKSPRPMPKVPPEPDYPPEAAVRRVRSTGEIKWKGGTVYVSESLIGEPVAIEETEAGEWALRFHHHPIGVIDDRTGKLRRTGRPPRGTAGAKPTRL
jgi:transposase InsO family protein